MKNKYTLTGIIILLSLTQVFAQSDFHIGVNASYLLNSRIITENNSDLFKDYRNDNETFSTGFNIGLNWQYNFFDNFHIETGINYSQKGYEVKEKMLIDPCFYPATCGFESEIHRYTYDYLRVPIHFIYRTTKYLNYSISLGASAILPLSSDVEWVLVEEFGKKSDYIKTRDNASDLRKFNFTTDFAFGVGYMFTDRINVILQPNVSFNILSYENIDIKERRYYNVLVSENKSTKENLISYSLMLKVLLNL
ncbi:MAG: outer membrane beta-barrel protein [Bacteroidota bacterium]|nr:outer membrane beta-barrel protein [Bacteroidota bacterium]